MYWLFEVVSNLNNSYGVFKKNGTRTTNPWQESKFDFGSENAVVCSLIEEVQMVSVQYQPIFKHSGSGSWKCCQN